MRWAHDTPREWGTKNFLRICERSLSSWRPRDFPNNSELLLRFSDSKTVNRDKKNSLLRCLAQKLRKGRTVQLGAARRSLEHTRKNFHQKLRKFAMWRLSGRSCARLVVMPGSKHHIVGGRVLPNKHIKFSKCPRVPHSAQTTIFRWKCDPWQLFLSFVEWVRFALPFTASPSPLRRRYCSPPRLLSVPVAGGHPDAHKCCF